MKDREATKVHLTTTTWLFKLCSDHSSTIEGWIITSSLSMYCSMDHSWYFNLQLFNLQIFQGRYHICVVALQLH